jgi:hypothetical protein
MTAARQLMEEELGDLQRRVFCHLAQEIEQGGMLHE